MLSSGATHSGAQSHTQRRNGFNKWKVRREYRSARRTHTNGGNQPLFVRFVIRVANGFRHHAGRSSGRASERRLEW